MFYLDDHIKHFINYCKQRFNERNKSTQPEFEIRINSVQQEIFDSLIFQCRQKYKEVIKESIVNIYSTTIDGISNQYREIIENGKTICQLKTGKENQDRMYTFKNQTQHLIRYSFSIEQTIDCPQKTSKPSFTRQRYRFEFDTLKGYTYMFTVITNKKPYDFEVEIEFDIEKMTPELISESIDELLSSFLLSNLSNDYSNNIYDRISTVLIPKPINIKETDSQILKDNVYYVTNKLDGQRFLLYFLDGNMYSIQNRNVKFICKTELNHCLVDTEFFKNKYYLFDCYIYNSINILNKNLPERLKCCELIKKSNPLFEIKSFSNQLLTETKNLLDTLNKDENDGLIYTPENFSKKLPVLKWKFPEKMSIDFRIIKDKQNPSLYTLCVFTKTDKYGETPFEITFKIKDELTPFKTKNQIPFKINKKNATFISNKPLIDYGIYEFMFEKGNFVCHRQREDKIKPNFINVAFDVYNDMICPFESFKLIALFRPLNKFRKYHNQIKREIITKFCKQKDILDLGIGQGGDLEKYNQSNINRIFGVEPYDKNYKEFQKRLSSYSPTFSDKVKLIITNAQNTDEIVKEVGEKGVDIIASFFSLSFFFFPDKPNDIHNLVETISQNLKEDGYFIGTTIDGEQVLTVTNNTNKTFDFDDGFIRIEKDNTVTFEVKGTIVETQKESLVNFNLLVELLKNKGIVLKSSEFFKENKKDLTPNENKLNSLYRQFVFQKENITKYIYEECKPNTIFNLITKSNIEKCFDLFRKVINTKKYNLVEIQPKDNYNILSEFYMVKKYINNLDSPYFIKYDCLFGTRLHKTLVFKKISDPIYLKDYTIKKDYPILRDQLLISIDLLSKKGLCCDLDKIVVYKNEITSILFNDYSSLKKGKISETQLKQLLDKLTT
jgi:hypothetical protein